METIILTIDREEVPVILNNKEGVETKYTLREMNGKERDSYLNTIGNKMKLSGSGKVIGLKSFDGLQAGLLSRCMIDENGDKVDEHTIQGWPTKTQTSLFKTAQVMNALDQDAEDEAKNE